MIKLFLLSILFGLVLYEAAGAATGLSSVQQACVRAVGDPDRRIAACSRILNAATRSVEDEVVSHDNRGLGWLDKGEPDRAILDFDEAIKLYPSYLTYNSRGIAWKLKGDFNRAMSDFNESIRLNPQYEGAYVNRAGIWTEKGEFDRAIAEYNESITRNPQNAAAYHNRGTTWQKMGEYDRAITDAGLAIHLQPKKPLYYANRGMAWRLKGDLDKALADQSRAVALSGPKPTLVLVFRGDTFRYRGEFRRAIADYEQALGSNANYIPALTGLGLTYERMGDLARARVKFEQAVTSQDNLRFQDPPKSALETARARLAALDSGAVQPSIRVSLPKATSATSIPTPVIASPVSPATVPPTTVKLGRRIALVIGNSVYRNVPTLLNPQRDAEVIAASLRSVGFEMVTLVSNETRENLIDVLRTFANEAEKADWAMVYYAGHGMEVSGVNYLIPVDAKLAADRDIQFESVPLDQVLAAVDGAKRLKIIMLDACRNNPFAPRKTSTTESGTISGSTVVGNATSRSIGRGLAEVKVQGATLVIFAAKNGQIALDGEGKNSPFAVAVVQRLATPGIEISKLFRLVRDDVMEATAGRQEPYTYGSLPAKEDFYFVSK